MVEEILIDGKKLRDQGSEGFIYDKKSILGEFTTFFIAGTDTTSHYLESMIIYLVKYPEIMEKVRREIQKYMKEDDYSYENLKNFKYI